MKKLPLVNAETKNIPIGPRMKGALKKAAPSVGQKCEKTSLDKRAGDVSCKLDVPKLHSTNLILKKIHRLEGENLNLTGMMEEKLSSPNTAKYIRRKKAQKVNVSASKNLFQDLVSADVSQNALIRDLEENLRQKAAIAQPTLRKPDPEPSVSDYYKPDEFVNVRVVGPSNIFPLKSSLKSFLYKPDRSQVTQYCDQILDEVEF